jgi:hypothetical protein
MNWTNSCLKVTGCAYSRFRAGTGNILLTLTKEQYKKLLVAREPPSSI